MTDTTTEPIECPKCGRTFETENQLAFHLGKFRTCEFANKWAKTPPPKVK